MSRKLQILLVLFLGFCQNGYSENLLTNGDFEFGDGGWNLWVLPEVKSNTKIKVAVKSGIGIDSSKGAKVSVEKLSDKNWHMQFQAPDWLSKKDQWYELAFNIKSKTPGKIHAAISGGGPTWEYVSGQDVMTKNSWQEVKVKFKAHRQGFKQMRINFYLSEIGEYYFDQVSITEIKDLDNSWYESAEDRIDSLRKGDFELVLKDKSGKILANQEIEVELKRHQFPFGTALAFGSVSQNSKDFQWYQDVAAELFWYGVPENDFKWPNYEPKQNKPKLKVLDMYREFAKKNDWQIRAHALEWGIEKYNFDKHWPRQKSCQYYQEALKNRILRDVKEYQDLFHEYDVWNETFHERAIFERCGYDLLDSAFIWAHQADPKAKLYLNEYSVVSGGETETYYQQIKSLLDKKIPLHGIGVQCHFSGALIEPFLIKERLDRLAEFGLPIKVTEFDIGNQNIGMSLSETEQADLFEKFIVTAFSHPAVDGILLWGFWDSRHWIKNGGIINSEKEFKPAAKRVKKLWQERWNTKLKIKTDKEGKLKFRGFYGKYTIKSSNVNIEHSFMRD